MPLTAGSRLGPFLLEAPLGTGGMGEVYRATDTRLSRTVALKVLHPRTGPGATTARLLEREARAIAALNHPNICTLYDVRMEGDTGYLVMEYLEGCTLLSLLTRGPLPAATTIIYARQLAGALMAAHARGVVHRDLKPGNIFITNAGTLKILDFGIARLTDAVESEQTVPLTHPGLFMGTVGYAAPEQLRGGPVDHRADIFAVGAVLSEMLSGHPPFGRDSTVDTMSAILHEPPRPLPPGAPPVLADAIRRCLKKDAADRFQSAAALLDALDTGEQVTGATPIALATAAVSAAATPSIAVLPFADLSPARDQEYFCDGMADELIGALMKLEGVRVASRTSAFQFKGRAEDVREIGRRLQVNTVLEGSVRRAGDRLRIMVQLTDVSEGFQVWSHRYDGSLDDVFAVQDEIARAIVEKLDVELPGRRSARIVPSASHKVEAYNLYLRGRYSAHKYTKEGMENGMACYKQALEIDPEYAEVHAELAHCFILFAIFSAAPPRAVMPMALASVERALAIKPDLAVAQSSLAAARFWYEWNWDGAETASRRAIELAPGDSWPRHAFSFFLSLRGRHDEALAMATAAQVLDPISPTHGLGVTAALYNARRFEEAATHASRSMTLEPSFFSNYWALALAQAGLGDVDRAIATLERGRPHAHGDSNLEGFLGWAYGLAGRHDEAREIARQFEARRTAGYLGGTHLGLVYQGLGDMDEAIRWYETAVSERATDCTSYAIAPHFDAAREDPRFRTLIAFIDAGGKTSP